LKFSEFFEKKKHFFINFNVFIDMLFLKLYYQEADALIINYNVQKNAQMMTDVMLFPL